VETTQLISILISLISLTVAACRAYFTQRDPRRADPEPTLHMMMRFVGILSLQEPSLHVFLTE
jgi:hypothetical protein